MLLLYLLLGNPAPAKIGWVFQVWNKKWKTGHFEAICTLRRIYDPFLAILAIFEPFLVIFSKRSKQKIKKSTFLELGHQNYDKKTIKWRCTFFFKTGTTLKAVWVVKLLHTPSRGPGFLPFHFPHNPALLTCSCRHSRSTGCRFILSLTP